MNREASTLHGLLSILETFQHKIDILNSDDYYGHESSFFEEEKNILLNNC